MNSKEVVNAVLNHEDSEYIPLGVYMIDYDIAEKILGHETYMRNKPKIQLGLWEGRRNEIVQSIKEDTAELYKKLGCIDILLPGKSPGIVPPADYVPPRVKKTDRNTWEDEEGNIYKFSYRTNVVKTIKKPQKYRKEDFEGDPEYKLPDESTMEAHNFFVEEMKKDRFLAGRAGGFSILMLLGGMTNGLMQLYLNPEMVKNAIKYNIKKDNFLDKFYIREGIDQIFVEKDFGTTKGPLISPDTFREFCLPAMKERIKNIKKYRDKVIFHSCGNTWKLIDMFIESGIDGYQSLQTDAGMNIKPLKEKYGRKLCFWGGVSIENLLEGKPEDVRRDVRYAMEHGKKEGGFILGPSHSISYGVKYDNFMAMIDEHDKLKYLI